MKLSPLFVVSAVLLVSGQEPQTSRHKPRILVAYFSAHGHTAEMARAVERGARSVDGVDVVMRTVAEATNDDVLSADAIVLGSPVYNANVAPAVQEFVNGWPFRGAPLRDKLGAAFVTAGGISAGEETTQLSLLHSMLVFGMVVVGGPDWKQPFGASGVVDEEPFTAGDDAPQDHVEPYFLAKGEALGRRMSELVRRWKK